MKESTLRTKILKALRNYSGWWTVTHADMFTETGVPDIIGVYQGRFYGLEVKLPGKLHTLSARQSRVLELIRHAGGRSAVVTSVDDALRFVLDDTP